MHAVKATHWLVCVILSTTARHTGKTMQHSSLQLTEADKAQQHGHVQARSIYQ
jgi:hypothetical protein